MSARPASSRSRRSSGRAWSPSAIATASRQRLAGLGADEAGVGPVAPAGPAIAPPMIASAWRQRAIASRYGSPSASQRCRQVRPVGGVVAADEAGVERAGRREARLRLVAAGRRVLRPGPGDRGLRLGEDPRGALA